MALTAYKSQQLEDAGLVKLFDDEAKLWKAMAKEAFAYTKKFVAPTGENVRPDDMLPVLIPALELADKLTDYLAENRLTQKYWFTYFGELIIDRLWTDLTKGE